MELMFSLLPSSAFLFMSQTVEKLYFYQRNLIIHLRPITKHLDLCKYANFYLYFPILVGNLQIHLYVCGYSLRIYKTALTSSQVWIITMNGLLMVNMKPVDWYVTN